MNDEVETGRGKRGWRAYFFNEIAVVLPRRTRDPEDVSLSWQFDVYYMWIPVMGVPMDSVTSPENAICLGKPGGIGVLDLEGLRTWYSDPLSLYQELVELGQNASVIAKLRQVHAEPVKSDLMRARSQETKDTGVTVARAMNPVGTQKWREEIAGAPLDAYVVRGSTVPANHVPSQVEPFDPEQFIHHLDTPVIVGGVATYTEALHLMRTGAAGVLVGSGGGAASTTRRIMGIRMPMAMAVADMAVTRRDFMDEPSGRYVHVITDGGIGLSDDIVKVIACGAGVVTLGTALARASEVPGQGWHWGNEACHSTLPRGSQVRIGIVGTLEQALFGPADDSEGTLDPMGVSRRTVATTGYTDVKELQRVGIIIG